MVDNNRLQQRTMIWNRKVRAQTDMSFIEIGLD